MYNDKIEEIIRAALADGIVTEKEKKILLRRAQIEGIDLDEFEMILDARLLEAQKAKDPALKSEKYGGVRKCPACGAVIPSFQGVCPECGHEFIDVDANESSKKLAEALLGEYNVRKQQQIIETFPLPNTKSDLLEFLTALKPQIQDVDSVLSNSYLKKYEECIEKAKVSFPNDKLIAPFIVEYKAVLKRRKKRSAGSHFKKNIRKYVGVLLFIALISLILVMCHTTEKNDSEKCNKKIAEAVINKKPHEAAKYIYEFEEDRMWIDGTPDVVQLFIQQNNISEAEKLCKYMDGEGSEHLVRYYLDSDNVRAAEEYKDCNDDAFYEYWLGKNDYENAWQYRWHNKNHLKEIIDYIAKNTSKEAAFAFLKLHIDDIHECNDSSIFNSKEEDRRENAKSRAAILKELNYFIEQH